MSNEKPSDRLREALDSIASKHCNSISAPLDELRDEVHSALPDIERLEDLEAACKTHGVGTNHCRGCAAPILTHPDEAILRCPACIAAIQRKAVLQGPDAARRAAEGEAGE